MFLSDLKVGDRFRVVSVTLGHEVGRRLADMGFIRGAGGTILRREVLNGPIDVNIIGYEVLLRYSEAKGIVIEKVGAAAPIVPPKKADSKEGRSGQTMPKMPEAGKASKDKSPAAQHTIRIGLAGNPNSGKTTLFNALTGSHIQVGNYPGVTVERTEGTVRRGNSDFVFTDLPGIYSLTAYSEDEVVSRDFLLGLKGEKPDFIIDVIDMTNLARHLNLTMQLAELQIPVIAALNMVEEAARKGITVDENILARDLHIPFIKINAKNSKGVDSLFDCMLNYQKYLPKIDEEKHPFVDYGEEVEQCLARLEPLIVSDTLPVPARWLAVKLLEKDKHAGALLKEHTNLSAIKSETENAVRWLEGHYGKTSEIVIAEQRYGYIGGAVREALTRTKQENETLSQKIDNIIMHRVFALPLFLVVLYCIFQLTFSIGAYPQGWLESFFTWLSDITVQHLPDTWFRSMLVNGVIAGVGGVLSFVPLIVILFFFLSILEDLGYMSRAAFATDKLLHAVGLHGQSIFPMMLGFGCSVPAIMASRTLKNKRDRIITVLVTPMMSCGAKLPIHVLIAGAFFGEYAGNYVMLIYACGVVTSLICAWILQHTALRGKPTPFVLELPPYRLPTWRGIGYHVWEKTSDYLRRAGMIILASSIIVWALGFFPLSSQEKGAEQMEYSYIGRAGKFIEPVFRPLHFNWKLSVATLTGFAAKEVVVSTLNVLYSGEDDDTNISATEEAIRNDTGMTPLVGFAFMLFMLLIPPCISALATIKNELGWKWLIFEFIFLFALGWLMAFLLVQIGNLIV